MADRSATAGGSGQADGTVVSLRQVTVADLPALSWLYRAAVEVTARSRYSAEQLAAWAGFASQAAFSDFVLGPETWVIERDGAPLAFCGFEPDGHVASLYVHPSAGRRGYATRLLRHVMARAAAAGVTELHAEASFLSVAVFQRCGFVVVGTETAYYGNVAFSRYRVAYPSA